MPKRVIDSTLIAFLSMVRNIGSTAGSALIACGGGPRCIVSTLAAGIRNANGYVACYGECIAS